MSEDLLPNNIALHRMVWSPDDFDGEQLLGSAFSRSDLQAGGFVSVDRVDRPFAKQTADRAIVQAGKADGNRILREEAHSVFFNCGQVREAIDSEKATPFGVSPRIEVDKPAHCGIENVTGKRGRSYIDELRTILVSLAYGKRTLEEVCGDYD